MGEKGHLTFLSALHFPPVVLTWSDSHFWHSISLYQHSKTFFNSRFYWKQRTIEKAELDSPWSNWGLRVLLKYPTVTSLCQPWDSNRCSLNHRHSILTHCFMFFGALAMYGYNAVSCHISHTQYLLLTDSLVSFAVMQTINSYVVLTNVALWVSANAPFKKPSSHDLTPVLSKQSR